MVSLNLCKNTAPCFLPEGKRDGAAKGAQLWPKSGPGVQLMVLAADVNGAVYENGCLPPLLLIKLYFQVAGHFRAASCRRRTCSSWFLPVARAAIMATARCSTATCAPWAALRTRAASVGQQSVSQTALSVAGDLLWRLSAPSSCRREETQREGRIRRGFMALEIHIRSLEL